MASAYQAFQRRCGVNAAAYKAIVGAIVMLMLVLSGGCGGSPTPEAPRPSAAEQPSDHASTSAQPAPDTSLKLTGELAQHFALIQQGHPDAARVRLRRYLDAQPSDGQAHFLFGLTYHVEKRYDKALESFARAREFAPTYGQAAYFQGWALYYMGQLNEAQEALHWYAQGSPDNADANFLLGLLAYDQGQLDEASTRFRLSEKLFRNAEQPRNGDIGKSLVRLADVQIQQGDFVSAQQSLSDAAALIPTSPEVHYKLAQVLRRQGLSDQAAQEQRMYEELWQSKHPSTSFPE